jgi:5-hydroxyisourate hydrolase-like protein (transthyretin family)
MRSLIVLIGVLVLCGVVSPTANACTCARPGTPCESYGAATAVFVGTATSAREADRGNQKQIDWAPKAFKFSVEQSYLGVDGTEIEVFTGRGGGDCGYGFQIGERYLVYASRYENRLTTGICTRTKPFAQAADDIAFLGSLLSAAAGATIYGQIKREITSKKDSSPIGADVAVKIEGDGLRREVQTDPHGHYRVSGLPPGKFKITLQLPDALTAHQPEREVTVADRGCASVVFYIIDNGRLSGRVFDAEAQPVARIAVSLMDPSDSKADFVKLDRTDDEGRFSFSAVPAGRYLIAVNFNRFPDPSDPTNAYPPAFYPGVVDQPSAEVITLKVGEKRTDLDIRVPSRLPASVLTGKVVWADGSPVASPFLMIIDATRNGSTSRYGVPVDEQGRFTINGYVGQKLVLEARSNRPNVSSPGNEPMERSEVVRITLGRPTETVKIVITKLR